MGLDRPEALDRAHVGGKASSLARLVERGLPVPEGFVVTVGAFRDFLHRNGLLESARSLARAADPTRLEALRAAVRTAPLDPSLAAEIRRRSGPLGTLLAVRSSAPDEDARAASFAGMYRTELGIRPGDALEHAVRACWESAFQEPVLAYRRRLGLPGEPAMAVVIQRLVQARAAGVLFTVNPMSGSWREMTVEVAWGLGEAVVSGQVVPDHYLVRRPRRHREEVQRVAARIRLDVIEETRSPQERRLAWGPAGLGWEEVPESRRNTPKINRADLFALCRMALRIEALHGHPQDVEWALDEGGRIVFLQARPITTALGVNRDARVLWTRRFIGERWTEPATPLGWSLILPLLEWFIAYPETNRLYLGGGDPLRLVDGAPYLNATVFRHLAFKLPGMPPPRFMMEMLPPEEERTWHSRFGDPPGFRVYASILKETFTERRWERFRWNPLTNHAAWDTFERRLLAEVPRLTDPPPRTGDDALERARMGMELARDYVKIHVTSLLFANLLYQVAGGLVSLWLDVEGDELAQEALRCPADNLTVRTNHDLWRLGRLALETGADTTTLPDPASPFGRALQAFLAEHGHRSDATWEIMSPRWAEQPERVLAMLRHHRNPSEPDPAALAREQVQAGEVALERIRERIDDPARRAFLVGLVTLTRKYLLLRENQRYRFDALLFAVKRSYLHLGRLWTDQGVLDRPDDVRFLEAGEVEALWRGRLPVDDARERVQRRSERWHHQKTLSPPDFLVEDEPVEATAPGVHRLEGLGASAGVARGRVRILTDLAEADRLQQGEILVARSTDPGWTPLFLVAKGVILELGGQLSHGAVVAREYRLPTVVNVRGATRLLRDGQEVTLDGKRGLVWVHG